MMRLRLPAAVLVAVMTAAVPSVASATARSEYSRALARDKALAQQGQRAKVADVRAVISAYRVVVAKYPRSPYADNALWQAGLLASRLYARDRRPDDARAAVQLFQLLVDEYPSSSLRPQAKTRLRQLNASLVAARKTPPRASPKTTAKAPSIERAPAAPLGGPAPLEPEQVSSRSLEAEAPGSVITRTPPAPPELARVVDVRRAALPDALRVTLELDREVAFQQQRLAGPERVFFDLAGAQAGPGLAEADLTYGDDVVRQIKVGRRASDTVRVTMNLDGADRYSVFTMYNPFRIVVDFERQRPATLLATVPPRVPPLAPAPVATSGTTTTAVLPTTRREPPRPEPAPIPAAPASDALAALPAPTAPAANAEGGFSLARQLGLGVSRIVIDPGHGGHDPGALGKGLSEADLVLDVALRLEKLLQGVPGVEVVLTRRTDVFVPLEQRTALANRERADLFLSIHANASHNRAARGVETYFLNFANNPEAEAVAARENSASERVMHNLPDLLKAIALNNKLDESRDLASHVQRSLVRKLRAQTGSVKDLGVKQAPFVVLIGAGMPSVLAEIAFITNPQEAQLLRSGSHRQKVAEALFEAVGTYQRSLKAVTTVASQEP